MYQIIELLLASDALYQIIFFAIDSKIPL